MRYKQILIISAIAFLTGVTSCKKAAPEQSCGSCPVGGASEPPAGFTYTKNQSATITADSAFFYSANRTIISYYHGTAYRITIKTTSQQPGVYSFADPNNGNSLSYIESPGGSYSATGGNLTISANLNGKIAGSFTTSGSGGGFVNVNGQFKDIKGK